MTDPLIACTMLYSRIKLSGDPNPELEIRELSGLGILVRLPFSAFTCMDLKALLAVDGISTRFSQNIFCKGSNSDALRMKWV